MKKIFLLSVIISLLFLFIESKSQDVTCPPGWSAGTTEGSIINPNTNEQVDFTLHYCWTIDENGQIFVRLRGVVFYDKTKLTGMNLASAELWNLFNELMLREIANNPSSQIPPCDQNTTVVISLQKVNCWHLQDLDAIFSSTFGYVNPNNSYLGLTPCNIWGAYCQTTYNVCWDYTTTPPSLTIVSTIPPLPLQVECPESSVPFDPNAPMSTECFSTCN